MFTLDHLVWTGITLFFSGILLFLSRKFKFNFKVATYIILGIYVASELFKIGIQVVPVSTLLGYETTVSGYSNAYYLDPNYLPFQLCSSMLFFIIYLVFAKNEKHIEFVKSLVIEVFLIAAPLAVLFGTCFNADNTAYHFASFKDPEVYRFFIYHGGMIWYGIYLLITKQVKMGFKAWWQSLVSICVMLVFSIFLNSVLAVYKTNFMFTVVPPAKGIPLINLKAGWVVYMIHYVFVVALATILLQLPFIIKEIRLKKASK